VKNVFITMRLGVRVGMDHTFTIPALNQIDYTSQEQSGCQNSYQRKELVSISNKAKNHLLGKSCTNCESYKVRDISPGKDMDFRDLRTNIDTWDEIVFEIFNVQFKEIPDEQTCNKWKQRV